MGKVGATGRQPVKARRLNVLVAVASQRIVPHLVGHDEEDVGLFDRDSPLLGLVLCCL
jgi:hypothetical protein